MSDREEVFGDPRYCSECGDELWGYAERFGMCSTCRQDEQDSNDLDADREPLPEDADG